MNNRLYQLRNERKLSQADIAKLLNISRQGYSRYERGEREANYETLGILADFFEVSIDYLIGHSSYYLPDEIEEKKIYLRYSYEERKLIEDYRKLNTDGKKAVDVVFKSLLASMAENKKHTV